MTRTTNPAGPAALSMLGIGKSFGPVHALQDVSFEVAAGEVMALLGENGAGKSTLLRILSGDHAPDTGEIQLHGAPVNVSSPGSARARGIRVIYQEPEIIPHVSVAENIFVGSIHSPGGMFSSDRLRRRAQRLIDEFGFTSVIAPNTLGSKLSPAQRQVVEILRALTDDPQVIAFDEPTSSLSDHEVDALFALIGTLRSSGVAMVYVSHRLKEISQIADRAVVLRDGRAVGDVDVATTPPSTLVRMMVGRDLGDLYLREPHVPGEVVLRATGVTTDDVDGIDLTVRAGEVVALAGLVGAGRSELARALMGDVALRRGTIEINGRRLRRQTPRAAVLAGVGLAPEERKSDALLMLRSVRDNISLAVLDRISVGRFVRRGAERTLAREYIGKLNIRTPSMEQEVSKLSGGNQQKIVVARWLARKPRLLILDEPTRGIDVGAKAEIYGIVNELAASGVALLVISSELPEVLGLADRIVVMRDGRVAGELSRSQATEERILTLAMPDTLDDPLPSAGEHGDRPTDSSPSPTPEKDS